MSPVKPTTTPPSPSHVYDTSSSSDEEGGSPESHRHSEDDDASSTGSSESGTSIVEIPMESVESEGEESVQGEEPCPTPEHPLNPSETETNPANQISPAETEKTKNPNPAATEPASQNETNSEKTQEASPAETEVINDPSPVAAEPNSQNAQEANSDFSLYGNFTEPNALPASARDLKPLRVFLASKGAIGPQTHITRKGDSIIITKANHGQTQAALAISSYDDQPFRFELRRPHFWELTRGTIRTHGRNADISPADLAECLAPCGVTDVWLQNGGQQIYVLTFSRDYIPNRVMIGQISHRVQQWHPLPQRCTNCQRYGHYAKKCTASPRCEWCLSKHNPAHCRNQPRCTDCGPGHVSSDKKCPKWLLEKDVLEQACLNHVHPAQARATLAEPIRPKPAQKQWRPSNGRVTTGRSYATTAATSQVSQPEVATLPTEEASPQPHQPQVQHQPLPSAAWPAVDRSIIPLSAEGNDRIPAQVMWLMSAAQEILKTFGFELKVTPIAPAMGPPTPQTPPTPVADKPVEVTPTVPEMGASPPQSPPTPAADELSSGLPEVRSSPEHSPTESSQPRETASSPQPSMPILTDDGWNVAGAQKKNRGNSRVPKPSLARKRTVSAGDEQKTSGSLLRPDAIRTRAAAARSAAAADCPSEASATTLSTKGMKHPPKNKAQ